MHDPIPKILLLVTVIIYLPDGEDVYPCENYSAFSSMCDLLTKTTSNQIGNVFEIVLVNVQGFPHFL